tara:strand:- start:458 stop:679 length:222 start_codon:yes stop_codon:yes gene_type:complete
MKIINDSYKTKLVDINKLIDILFDDESAPSKRFLMQQKALGNLPHIKFGRRVFYNPEIVTNHLYGINQKEVQK